MTDELIVRKVKNMIKATPVYAGSKRVYRRIIEANLKKEEMAPQTRQMLKEKFQDDVALLAVLRSNLSVKVIKKTLFGLYLIWCA